MAKSKTSKSSGSSYPPANHCLYSRSSTGSDRKITFSECVAMYKHLQSHCYDFNLFEAKDKAMIIAIAFNGGLPKLVRDAKRKYKNVLAQEKHKIREIVYRFKLAMVQRAARQLNHFDAGFYRMYAASVRLYRARWPSANSLSAVERANRHSRLSVRHARKSRDIYSILPPSQKRRAVPTCAVESSRAAAAAEQRLVRMLATLP